MESIINNPDNTGEKQGRVPPKEHRWSKGQSGNPAGRPKGSISVVTELKKKLEETPKEGNPEKKRYVDMLVIKVIEKALADGDVSMIKDMIDRIDGKPRQSLDLSGMQQTKILVLPSILLKKNGIEPKLNPGPDVEPI